MDTGKRCPGTLQDRFAGSGHLPPRHWDPLSQRALRRPGRPFRGKFSDFTRDRGTAAHILFSVDRRGPPPRNYEPMTDMPHSARGIDSPRKLCLSQAVVRVSNLRPRIFADVADADCRPLIDTADDVGPAAARARPRSISGLRLPMRIRAESGVGPGGFVHARAVDGDIELVSADRGEPMTTDLSRTLVQATSDAKSRPGRFRRILIVMQRILGIMMVVSRELASSTALTRPATAAADVVVRVRAVLAFVASFVRVAAGSSSRAMPKHPHRRFSNSTWTPIGHDLAAAVTNDPTGGAVQDVSTIVAVRPRRPPEDQPLTDNPGRPAVSDQPVGGLRPEPSFEPLPVGRSLGRQRRRPPPRFTFDERHRHVRPLQCRQVLEQPPVFGPWRPPDDTVSAAARSVRQVADDRRGPRRVIAHDQPFDVGHSDRGPRRLPTGVVQWLLLRKTKQPATAITRRLR
jgi:hypothetical protein